MTQLDILKLALEELYSESMWQKQFMEKYKDYEPIQDGLKKGSEELNKDILELHKLIIQEEKGA